MCEQDMTDNYQSMESLLKKLEDSFAEVRQALLEANQKTAFYEGFDETIRGAVANALEVAKGIRLRAAQDAEAAQESLERETNQVLSEITALRERCQQFYEELRLGREAQQQQLQRERESFQQELDEMRAKAEREVSLLQERSTEERNRLLEEIAALKQQRELLYSQLEAQLAGHLKTVESSLVSKDEAAADQDVAQRNAAASPEGHPQAITPPAADQVLAQGTQPEKLGTAAQQPEAHPIRPSTNGDHAKTYVWDRAPTGDKKSSSLTAASQRRRPRRGIWDILFGRY
ncbi:MAG: hypothetical protein EPO21_19410 [Chloroflexota bacterium]|nr:MAG: hypothetical protein EPO21_19410 [Chloroflexota bacterium]